MDLIDKLQQAFPIHYRKGDILLMQADCMEVMKLIPDKAIDLAIVDPPYGISINTNIGRRKGDVKSKYHKFAGYDKNTPNEDYYLTLNRVSKNQIIWGGNYMTDYLYPSPCWILWDKGFSSEVTFAQYEMAWTSFKSSAKKFDYSAALNNWRIHPTQKPIKLYKWLLTNYAKPDQLIFDSHGGSFSSAIAAHYFGCKFIGCELDADYFQAAVKRFKKETAQVDLFCE